MIIGIDLDEVLAELIDYCLYFHDYKINGKKIRRENITDYYIHHMVEYAINLEKAIDWFRQSMNDDMGKYKIRPVDGAYEKLKSWKEKGYKLKVITARPGDLFKEYTLNWLDKYYPNIFDDVFFASDAQIKFNKHGKDETKKSIVCKNLGVDVMIEDNFEYAHDVASCGIKTYLITKPWNKKFKETENIIRVNSWKEIYI